MIHDGVIPLLGYLLGSIPTALWIGEILNIGDIRHLGSGNSGGTNAYRTMGPRIGIFVGLFDVGKGVLATLYLPSLTFSFLGSGRLPHADLMIWTGVASIVGHIWTLFAGFRGGKGVATATGFYAVVAPKALVVCLFIFALNFFLTRRVSLGSVLAMSSIPLIVFLSRRFDLMSLGEGPLGSASVVVMFLIIVAHRENIKRLWQGKERPLSRL